MRSLPCNTYDVVIIGAGIGGLVSGCYLAKAGMKVMIAEQHSKPGGYCTSFKRQRFVFDAAAHSIGGCRQGGIVRTVLEELGLDQRLEVKRSSPSDIVISPSHRIAFHADKNRIIEDLQQQFPNDADNIPGLINYLWSPDLKSLTRYRNATFSDLLNDFVRDDHLKAILSYPLLGNGGLPPSRMSAFIGSSIFREFLLDGGYHTEKGMQQLSNVLAERFREMDGDLRLSCPIEKIITYNDTVKGIVSGEGLEFNSRHVISSCDARQTFLNMLDRDSVPPSFRNKINGMSPSLSMFIVYLGVKDSFVHQRQSGLNVWLMPDYDLDKIYRSVLDGRLEVLMVRFSPNLNTVLAFMNAPYRDAPYWGEHRENMLNDVVERIENQLLPGLSGNILYKETATPETLYKFTLNFRGASYGWDCTTSQFSDLELHKPAFLKGLYLASHWSTQGIGIPGVMYIGRDIANFVTRRDKIRQSVV